MGKPHHVCRLLRIAADLLACRRISTAYWRDSVGHTPGEQA